MPQFKKGIFTPIHPEKYRGRTPIIFRSSWEYGIMKFFDSNPSVISWSSESISIGYINPITGRPSRYFPDFLFTYKDRTGIEITELVEVKPFKQTHPPKATKGKRKSTLLLETKNWLVNKAKWEAAQVYCQNRSIKFRIMTEKELFL